MFGLQFEITTLSQLELCTFKLENRNGKECRRCKKKNGYLITIDFITNIYDEEMSIIQFNYRNNLK